MLSSVAPPSWLNRLLLVVKPYLYQRGAKSTNNIDACMILAVEPRALKRGARARFAIDRSRRPKHAFRPSPEGSWPEGAANENGSSVFWVPPHPRTRLIFDQARALMAPDISAGSRR
jgi:hypothetical protein